MEIKKEEMKTKRFDRSDLMSILAVLISLGALGVSLFEANIMRDQQQIMQEQKKASVWPYLEANSQYSYDFKDENWKVRLNYSILNKGVGPAKIVDSELKVGDKIVEKYSELIELVDAILQDSSEHTETVTAEISYGIPSGILSPDETFQLLQLNVPRTKKGTEIVDLLQIEFSVCYCSIYDDCWTVHLGKEEPVEGCTGTE